MNIKPVCTQHPRRSEVYSLPTSTIRRTFYEYKENIAIMGSTTIILCLVSACVLISTIEAAGAGSCPLPSKVYSCSPKCTQNYECTHGKVCCPNSCNAKSCAEPAAYGGAGAGGDKYSQSGGAGVYCGNVKCSSFEVCKTDPATKRQKCGRA